MQVLMCWLFLSTKQDTWTDSVSMGLMMAFGINVAHELIHKTSPFHKWCGRRLLEFSGYGFWEWQHIKGHHKNVGLLEDPATAPKGMSVYAFIPRCIKGTIQQAWEMNPSEFKKSIFRTGIVEMLILIVFGVNGMLFHLRASCISILFLETINYLEHYGLTRDFDETVKETHSWDAPYSWSSIILFKLPFHADHHLYARKGFSELEIKTNSPTYPFSYPIMVILSFFPPLFFKVSHPQLS